MQVTHLGRTCIVIMLDRRPVDRYLSIMQRSRAWSFCRAYRHRANGGMGKSFYIGRLRSPEISMPISSIDVIDNGDIIDHRGSMHIAHVVVADIDAGDMLPGAEGPITCRGTISAECNADVYTRSNRRPAIVTAVFAPGDPGRRPFISRHPYPSISVVIEPVAVVKRSPAPAVVG